ncbi:hypothetical protein [Pararhizobium haloflavum]|uniref:hypothetical protein n=1 Tax=Pararhizobium haloflavum TaxID=2037914 RepID=UPI000C176CCD|nr:hypothetical protein [Pararhizobium haloflavum]
MADLNFRGIAAVSLLALVAGCSSTGEGGGLSAALRGGPGQQSTSDAPQVVQGNCPNVGLREGTAYYRSYASGGDGDPSKVVHQASIADTTRQCTLSGNEIVMNVTAAGRLVAGPSGGPGTVEMPIRVAAVRGNEVIYSELTDFSAQLDSASGQFLFSNPNVRIPAEGAENVRVYVGFDEGPYDTP